MQIAFRVDASVQIGTGHFMRCLTLARELLKQGAEITFICRHSLPALTKLLEQDGINFKQLPASPTPFANTSDIYADWLGTTQLIDAEASIAALSDMKVDWLIVDHYALDHTWEEKLKPHTDKVMVIDDLANRKHQCDLLLDQNYYHDGANPYHGLIPQACQLLLGPRYALLRPEFRQLRSQVRLRDNQVQRILIFFGGVDANDYTSKAIDAISTIEHQTFAVDVVIGDQHPNKENIIQACHQVGYQCHIHTTKMAELIAQSDLCIGAGGSATWERCALGLPTITICVADNQRVLCQNAAQAGLIYLPEWDSQQLTKEIKVHVEAVLKNPFLRKEISQKSIQWIDVHGVERVISYLSTLELTLKVANADDMRSIFEWRNHPEIRAISRNQRAIDWDKHQAWYTCMLSSNKIKLLIAYMDQSEIGVVRFDLGELSAEISIYLIPGITHNRLGTKLLDATEKWLKLHHPEIHEISAEVLANNVKSQHFFLKNGFTATSSLFTKRLYQ
ncbi:UDP-2,4-diacetamido-2,4,6-trideoxy-beta-L-altropyranose hydrolase [Methylobacillus pratensis]